MRSGRRWRKSHNATGLGQERTGPVRERRVREERSGNLIVEERQEDRHKGGSPNNSPNGKLSPCHRRDSSSGQQEKGGANRSPGCSHRVQSKNCFQCRGRGEQEGCETQEGPRGDGVVLKGLNSEVEGMKRGKQEKVEEEEVERGGLPGLKSCVAPPVVSDPDPETSRCDPESHSDGDTGEDREGDGGETRGPPQTHTAHGKDFNTEDGDNADTRSGEGDTTGGVMKTQTGGGGGINNHTGRSSVTSCSTLIHNGDYDDKNTHSGEMDTFGCGTTEPTETSEGTAAGFNGIVVDRMVPDGESEGESERSAGSEEKTQRSNSRTPVRSSDVHRWRSEEGCLSLPSLLSSAPVPHPSAETSEPSTPAEGSKDTADSETPWEREEREKSTSDGECRNNNNNNEGPVETDRLVERSTRIVDEDDKRLTVHHSSSVVVDEEELCAEGKLLEVADSVKETFIEPVSEPDPEDTQATSEEAGGPCEQPGETPREVREEEEAEEGDGQVEGHIEVDACILETDRGTVRAAAADDDEEDFTRGEEAESRGAELNEKREDRQRDEVNEEYREVNEKLEREEENLVDGDRTAKEGNRTEETRREDYSDTPRDGGIKRGNVEEHNTDEKLDKWTDGHGEVESYGENIGEVKGWMTKGERRTQQSAEEWRMADAYADPLAEETGGERGRGETGEACSLDSLCPRAAAAATATGTTTTVNAAPADPATSLLHAPANPAPPRPPAGAMATGLPCLEVGGARAAEGEGKGASEGGEGDRVVLPSPEEQGQERKPERGSTVATEQERGRPVEEEEDEEEEEKEEEEEEEGKREEEDEFGMFMQAEEESAWSEGFAVSASVPCGNGESAALGSHGTADDSTYWTSSWTDSSFHHSEDTWTAFPQDSSDEGRDAAGQWWPVSAVEERRDRPSTNQTLSTVFAEAFPPLPVPSCCDSDAIPTLTQLLREGPNCSRTSQDQGLLDNFHDLNKMIGQRYKRANCVSRDLLLQSLHLDHTHTDSRTGPRTANHRLSPGLPSSNQHVPTTAAKRRLSYDYNKNIME